MSLWRELLALPPGVAGFALAMAGVMALLVLRLSVTLLAIFFEWLDDVLPQ